MSDEASLTPRQQQMVEAYERHTASEFETQNVDTALETMVTKPHVTMLPVMIGGTNREEVRHFYAEHFVFSMPADVEFVPISRTVGNDTIVEESILRFTHAEEIDWMLPGVAPTGRRVEIAVCTVARMEGEKVAHEHIYWDQASVLAQLGLLDAETLPVVGAEAARQLPTPTGPLNHLIARVRKCCPRGESR